MRGAWYNTRVIRHPDGRFERTDAWREGKWVDLWSVVHLISGICLGLGIYLLRFDVIPALIISLLLLVAYEMWEAMVRIEETPANRTMDVVIGMASLVPTYLWLAPNLSLEQLLTALAVFLAVDAVLSGMGWYASQKAAALEERMRERLERIRERRRGKRPGS